MELYSLPHHFNIDLALIIYHITHMGIAFLLALPIAWDREQESRSAGLRTFPLVSVASCSFALIALSFSDSPDAQGKILSGIITGIGFIGGGAIVKAGDGVNGTATAAGIWITGAIGIAIAMKYIAMAVAMCLFTLFVYLVLGKFKKS